METRNDLEHELRSLTPASNPMDPSLVMYECGFAAGRADGAANSSGRARGPWAVAATVLLTAVLSAGGGYGLATRLAIDTSVATMAPSELPQNIRVTVEPSVVRSGGTESESEDAYEYESEGESDPDQIDSSSHIAATWAVAWINSFIGWPVGIVDSVPRERAITLTARTNSVTFREWLDDRSPEHRGRGGVAREDSSVESIDAPRAVHLTPRSADAPWQEWIQ